MDYSKSGGGKPSKNAPRFNPNGASPKGKAAQGGKSSKDELLARMKAAAQAKKDGSAPGA
ncbi:hypothetical protein AL036_07420 [Salipiger aestuarii]|uniref:Uncharacterized protein n=1 Tax=Salipiger aestuarii TaxID=568098 RepID=A0A327Y9W5_9RHOB|nr:hypothetical protein [Salipiger aestuarii]EIE51855.1 hypothetical protein C357_06254 [Citreicella sp. 357]KAA8608294.1 hypothetical protein AL036_07420 [Salipiger aestuarii]KAA8612852.1 hypothetical protein AL037_06935 [Salipiger aestuarii]KAB2542240.1 hypothetical protein AL035_08495 [Salipiger aestuarii]RAK16786.1 hypothetical protein ATI53_10183 [Salipiger aestuarii]